MTLHANGLGRFSSKNHELPERLREGVWGECKAGGCVGGMGDVGREVVLASETWATLGGG